MTSTPTADRPQIGRGRMDIDFCIGELSENSTEFMTIWRHCPEWLYKSDADSRRLPMLILYFVVDKLSGKENDWLWIHIILPQEEIKQRRLQKEMNAERKRQRKRVEERERLKLVRQKEKESNLIPLSWWWRWLGMPLVFCLVDCSWIEVFLQFA